MPAPADAYAPIADLYDYVELYRTRPDIGFFVDEARASGGPVLEVGCGTGRVLIPTARAGLTITGVDLSTGMLEICRERLRREPEEVRARVHLVEADMRSFEVPGFFRLATLPFRPFQHLLTVNDQLAALESIRIHLVPGGKLILDVFNPSLTALTNDPSGIEFGNEPAFTTPDGRRVVRRQKILDRDYGQQVLHIALIYHITFPDGRTETATHDVALRYFFRYEIEHMLARAGYVVRDLFGDYDRSPFGTLSPGELIFVAERKG